MAVTVAGEPAAGTPRAAGAPPIWRRPGLVAVCVLVPLMELAGLWASGAAGDRALASQVTAPSPWDLFHDLRWALVIHDSWWSLALEGIGILLARAALDTAIVHLAWPTPADRPPLRAQFRRTLIFVAVAGLLLLPWTVIGFGLNVVPISWLFFGAVPPVIVVALVLHPGAVSGDWWRRIPPWRSVAWILLTFAVLTATGIAVTAAPAPLWVPVVAAGGLFNAWAWMGIVAAVTGRRARRFAPVAPMVAIGMLAAAVVGATLSFQVIGSRTQVTTGPPATEGAAGPPVLIAGGFDSRLAGADPHPIPGPFDEVRYSYRGLDPAGRPLPYEPVDTHQSLEESVRQMAAQVDALHRRSGQPVALVAESEGSLVARTYLAAYPEAPVERLILLSPLDQPARVSYPVAGHQGYGVLSGYALRALTRVVGGISPIELPADSPFLRSIVDHSTDLRNLLSCPVRVPEALIEPLADAVADPAAPSTRVPTVVVAAFHGGLLTDRRAQREVATLLSGGTVASNATLTAFERVIRLSAAPWQVPALPLSFTGGPSDNPSCASMEAGIRSWIRGSG